MILIQFNNGFLINYNKLQISICFNNNGEDNDILNSLTDLFFQISDEY